MRVLVELLFSAVIPMAMIAGLMYAMPPKNVTLFLCLTVMAGQIAAIASSRLTVRTKR